MSDSPTPDSRDSSHRDSTPSGYRAGTVLDARYRLTQSLGQTPVVESYFGTHLELGRSVCIDVLADLSLVRAFHRAARRMASVRHPNVALVHDFGEEEGRPYLVLEDVGTNTLEDQLRVHGPFGLDAFASVGRQLLCALTYLHAKRVLHRALATHTVFVAESWSGDEHLKLARFSYGAAPEISSGQISKAAHRALLASVANSPPERLLGEAVDHRGDLYSAGCLLYELLSGVRPFPGDDFGSVARAVVEAKPRSLLDFDRPISPALDRAVRTALEKNPDDRYASAAEMWEVIGEATASLRATVVPFRR